MTRKEEFKNNILIVMQVHLNREQMSILENVMIKELHSVDIKEMDTQLATTDYSNEKIWELFEFKKGPKLSAKTVTAYQQTLDEFTRYCNKSWLHVEENDIDLYLLLKKREGNGQVSLNNKLKKLSAFYTWMRKSGLIIVNPAENIEKFTEIEKPIDHMDPAEVEQMKSGCKHKRDRALMEWLRCTAMRGGEVPMVSINQVNWNTGTVTIIYGEKGTAFRPVCLDDVAIQYLTDYIKERGENIRSTKPLFTHLKGNHDDVLQRGGINSALKAIAMRAGIDRNIYTHLFRKTTATNIVRRGGSDADAGEYLGHKPQGVTGKHYTYKSSDRIVDIFRQYVQAV